MTAGYAALVRRPPARRLIYALSAACLSFGMLSLTLLLTVQRATGSYAEGGYAVALFAIAAGGSAPFRGRAVDRRGAHWLVGLASGYAASLCVLAVLAHVWPRPEVLLFLSFTTGLSAPPLFASARSAWPTAVEPELLRRGYAVTSLINDVGQVVGPAFAGVLVLFNGWLAPFVCAGMCLTAGILSASARTYVGVDPTPMPRLLSGRGMPALLAVSIVLGLAIGSLQVAVPTLAASWGRGSLAGPLLASFALGSVLGALWFGAQHWRGAVFDRYLIAAIACGGLVAPLAFAPNPWTLAVLLLLVGLAFGPATVALFEVLDVLAPGGGAEALTWVTSAEAGGSAIGSGLAGALGGGDAAWLSFVLPAVLLAGAAGAALALRRRPARPATELDQLA
jgi:MFS family permease